MSTTPVESWAVDLKDVSLIYPWVGSEWLMVLVAVVLWIAWHFWQGWTEGTDYRRQMARHASPATLRKATDPD